MPGRIACRIALPSLTFPDRDNIVGPRANMNIVKATRRFEEWLGYSLTLVRPDIRLKHQLMAEGVFPFLRATFYRWMQIWPEVCATANKAPRVLAVGDLHVENFGTWRDVEGRLVWGVNDFDEAAVLPYTVDLVRLATSALVGIEEEHLSCKPKDSCMAILDGYKESLARGGQPFVLEEYHTWLRQAATGALRSPVRFWNKMDSLPKMTGEIPPVARMALDSAMPEKGLTYRLCRRVAGLGSLGHIRVVAIAQCHGSRVAREAKALAPSSADWFKDQDPSVILYSNIVRCAVRCPDPFLQLRGRWIVRRLSPHCSRIELSMLPANRDELRLLSAMGWETANVHLGSAGARKLILRHLDKLKLNWLFNAAVEMQKAVEHDWRDWRKSMVRSKHG